MHDWRDFIRKPRNWIAISIVLMVLVALVQSFFQSAKTNLPSYVATPTPAPTATPPSIETVQYQNKAIALSMLAPADWTFVTKSGNDSYINPFDGATLMIDVHEYDPYLNAITQETVEADVRALDGVLGGFAKDNTHSYLAIYEVGSADYFEYNCWDLQHTVRITMSIPTERYSYYYDSVLYLFDSIAWQQEYPIPDDFYLYYSEYGNFEFGVPVAWIAELVNGELQVHSPHGSVMTVSLTSNSSDLSGLSQIDYVNAASNGKSNYLLSTYSNTGATLTAEASYNINGANYSEVRMILCNGTFWYEFSFECPQAAYNADGNYFLTAVNLFRTLE